MPRAALPRRTSFAGVLALAVVLLSSGVAFAGAVPASPAAGGPPGAGAPPDNATWASFPAGSIQVVFPSALPQVDLVDAANTSMGAALQVDALLELASGGLPRPTIVAAAFPREVAGFNASPSATPGATSISQSAVLNVHTVGAALWSSSGIATYLGPSIGSARLLLTYSVLPTPNGGVSIAWSVVGWPWVASTDLLALEFHFSFSAAETVLPCVGAGSAGSAPSVCPGASLGGHGITWDSAITSVVASGPNGTSASLGWVPRVTLAGGASSPMLVGTFATTNSSAEVVLGASAMGSSQLSGVLSFSLYTPVPPTLPGLVHGASGPYAAALVASLAIAGIGVVLYRRRDRRIRDEL